jgi:hypothetical protein
MWIGKSLSTMPPWIPLFHAVHALDDHVLGVHAAGNRAALALVAAGDDHHVIALLDALHAWLLAQRR